MKDLSRDAQTVAYCMFLVGRPQSVNFARPHIIHPRMLAGLEELAEAGLLEPVPASELPRGGRGWKAAAHLKPIKDFREQGIPEITKDDSFPITTEIDISGIPHRCWPNVNGPHLWG